MSSKALPLAALAAAGLTLPSLGQIDVSIAGTLVVQSVNSGSTPMVAGKSTFVRVGLTTTGTPGPSDQVDALLHIFNNGVEIPGSPIYSVNGPIVPPALADPLNLDDSINFQFIPPEGEVSFQVELNPAGPNQVPETDFSNNAVAIPAQTFICRKITEMVYVPLDYRPGGGSTPNLPDPQLIEPGVGDNFFQGIFVSPDVEYRIYDQGFKLWTQSLNGSATGLNNVLTNELQLMVPKPDFMYAWVPGGLPYNGQTNSTTAVGNTQSFKHQRTMAHEHGHILGKPHNTANISTIGIDVEHQLNIPVGLPQVKDPLKKDIMAAGLNTNQAWVWPSNYTFFGGNSRFTCAEPATFGGATVYVQGTYDRATGTFDLGTMMTLENLRAMPSVDVAEADLVFEVLGLDGETELGRTGFSWELHCFGDVENPTDTLVSVCMTLPQTIVPEEIGKVRILDRQGNAVNEIARSQGAPEVTITAPRPTELIPDTVTLEWTAVDAEGDALNQHVRYSPDGERFVPLATEHEGTSLTVDMRRLPRMVTGKGFFEVVVSDGLNTTVARTEKLRPTIQFASFVGGLPDTHIVTPDNGKTYPKGSPVILHSSGWDLEDRALTGASVVWTSDLDGFLGTGRLFTADDLSVGTHTLTVTVTDSSNQTDSDTTVVTILDRPLPGAGVICQQDLSFGGPGTASLSVCGGDLSSGTVVDISVVGAAPSTSLWLLVGSNGQAAPFFGGAIVPNPVTFVMGGMTDVAGNWTLADVAGGGGVSTLFLQAVYLDPAQTLGVGITNAVQANVLP